MGISNLGRAIFRIGEVTSTLPDKGKVRVKFDDMDKVVSHTMWVLYRKTKHDKDYEMPDIGDQAVCCFLGNGVETGVVLGCIYSDVDKPPVSCQDKHHRAFADGSWLEFDRKTHELKAHIEGDIDIFATGVINIKAKGKVFINGAEIRLNSKSAPENKAAGCGEKRDTTATDGNCSGGAAMEKQNG